MSDCARTEERLVDYLEDALPPHERAALEAHAAHCRPCDAALRESRAILAAYRSVPEEDVSPALAERLRAAARAERAEPRVRRSTWVLAAAAAMLLLTALASVFWREHRAASDSLAARLREAEAHFAAGDTGLALASYEQALELAGDGERAAEILYRLGALHVARGDFDQALARLGQVISTHPDYAGLEAVLLLRGQALEGLGRPEEALAVYRVVVSEFPAARDEAERKILALGGFVPDVDRENLQALGYGGE